MKNHAHYTLEKNTKLNTLADNFKVEVQLDFTPPPPPPPAGPPTSPKPHWQGPLF
jgi:hypothetical protein